MRLLLALLMAAGLVAVPAAQAQSQAPLTVIRAVGPPNDGFKAVFYGVKSGIFKKYGLDVQTSIVASGAAAAAALERRRRRHRLYEHPHADPGVDAQRADGVRGAR